MNWNRSEVIALSKEGCVHCGGHGFKPGTADPCNCVFRSIFKACYGRFRRCTDSRETGVGCVRLEPISKAVNSPRIYGRKNEEFLADFVLIAKRTLTNAQEFRVFKFHFLLGADWKLCVRQLGMDKGSFFHSVYRIQQKLGRAFRETQPYGIFPLDEYFGGSVRVAKTPSNKVVKINTSTPVRPPLRPIMPVAA